MNKLLRTLRALFDLICGKKWKVDVGSYSGGNYREFSSKEDALEFASKYKDSGYWVDLINNITKEETRINDPQEKEKDPNCKHEWQLRSRASWWCSKCNAQFNLSCEDSGSIACSACVDKFTKENEPFEDYLAEHSW